MPETASRHVFVYGTLRRGQGNDINRLSPAPRWVGEATVQGAMFHLGAYPGVLLGGADAVRGEVYAIDRSLEDVLDRIEGIAPQPSGEYRRREIAVSVAGRILSCLVYEVNPARVAGRLRIPGGDWVRAVVAAGDRC